MGLMSRLFGRTEDRSGAGYEATILGAFEAQAAGGAVTAASTAALEIASSAVARAFAAARVVGPAGRVEAVNAHVRAQIGRSLIRLGEQVLAVDVDPAAGVRLHVAGFWDVYGPSSDPAGWTYRVSLYGPSGTVTRYDVPAGGVVHCRYLTDPVRPWEGVAPLRAASIAGRLSAEVAAALADEAAGPRGTLIPTPDDPTEPKTTAIATAVRGLRGSLAFVESMNARATGGMATPQDDWKPRRLGLAAPAAAVELAAQATGEVLSACGVPSGMFGEGGDGTGQREAFRRFLTATINPLGELVSAELSEKLDAPIRLDFSALRASDTQGAARAAGALIKGGVEVERALALAGLENDPHQ